METSSHHDTGRRQWIHAALDSYEKPLTRYAQRILGDAEGARDVVQETFVRLCRAKPQEINGHLAAWLFTVCRNQALSVRRKEDHMTVLTEATGATLATPDLGPALAVEQCETAACMQQCLQQLPQNQQTVIRLKFQHELSYKQIAETTGLSVSNVGFLIHRGLKALRQQMLESSL